MVVHNKECSAKKKPTWQNTLRYSATSAYLLTGLPAQTGCPLSSHPTTLIQRLLEPIWISLGLRD